MAIRILCTGDDVMEYIFLSFFFLALECHFVFAFCLVLNEIPPLHRCLFLGSVKSWEVLFGSCLLVQ